MYFRFTLKSAVVAALCIFSASSSFAANPQNAAVEVNNNVQANVQNITLDSPKEYQVFQRKSLYDGYIRISGNINTDCDKLQARITGTSLKGNLNGKWQTINFVSQTHSFVSTISVIPGGWYKVDLQATKGKKVVAQASVDKVGVGEVFVGAGQSNSTNCAQERTSQKSGMVSSFSGKDWQLANDPQPGPHDNSQGGSFWPSFGDAMYERYHVPIGVAVTGHGGTSATQWQPDNPMGLYPWMMTRIYQLGYQGFRAVLWHQGEADAVLGTSTDNYVSLLSNIIKQSKMDAGWEFPWFTAEATYQNGQNSSYPTIRNAQQKLWDTGISLEGPDTDTLTSEYRDHGGAGIHFSPKGLSAHGKMWAEKVSAYLDKILKGK